MINENHINRMIKDSLKKKDWDEFVYKNPKDKGKKSSV